MTVWPSCRTSRPAFTAAPSSSPSSCLLPLNWRTTVCVDLVVTNFRTESRSKLVVSYFSIAVLSLPVSCGHLPVQYTKTPLLRQLMAIRAFYFQSRTSLLLDSGDGPQCVAHVDGLGGHDVFCCTPVGAHANPKHVSKARHRMVDPQMGRCPSSMLHVLSLQVLFGRSSLCC